jgi:hypothetical protein
MRLNEGGVGGGRMRQDVQGRGGAVYVREWGAGGAFASCAGRHMCVWGGGLGGQACLQCS